jgi:hypothetical protein
MEPVTALILSALLFGVKEMASEAVKDSYRQLKALVVDRFTGNEEAIITLGLFEQDQSRGQEKLLQALSESKVEADAEIVAAAQKLISLINPQQAASGKYNTQICGNVQGFAQGDNLTLTMNFSNDK